MDDLRAQLDALRARIRQIETRRAETEIDDPLEGSVVTTPHGTHLEIAETVDRHGGFHFSRLEELSVDALSELTEGVIERTDPSRMAFLDTETTGLAGGSGTVAFLVGVGRLTNEGLCVRQYVMRDFDEEASMLHAVAEDLSRADVLVTYNGKSYDEPLLATRYTLSRIRPPFARMEHLDLLHSARRLWKLRFESCRLMALETEILGFSREGDVPGSLIPQIYFDFLRTKRAMAMRGVLRHNALDILTLAALTAILPERYATKETAGHAAEMVGLGRWMVSRGERNDAIVLFEQAIQRVEFDRLPGLRRRDVFLELTKHYEHKQRNLEKAMAMALEILAIEDDEVHHRRVARLQRKLNQNLLR